MKEFVKKYIIEKEWFPVLIFLILILVNLIINVIPFYIVIFFGIVFLFISGIIQIFNKKWEAGILNFGIIIFIGIIFYGFSQLLQFVGFGIDTDTFADDLKLPKNVKLEKPINLKMGDNFEAIRPEIKSEKVDFQLYNSFQPGVYECDFWIKSKQSGVIFLKAYEITQNIELSNLKETTSVRIKNTNGIIEKFSSKNEFFIYEGDWGKPYGARFEVWFKPDNNIKERKILEENYIIEGWQR